MPNFYSDLGLLRVVRMTFTSEPYFQVYGETTDSLGRLMRLGVHLTPISLGTDDLWIYELLFNVNEDAVPVRMVWTSNATPILVSFPEIFNFGPTTVDDTLFNINRGVINAQSVNEKLESDAAGVFITRRSAGAPATRYSFRNVPRPDNTSSLCACISVWEPSSGTARLVHNIFGAADTSLSSPFMRATVFGGEVQFQRLSDVGATPQRNINLGPAVVIQPTAAEDAILDWMICSEFGRTAGEFAGYVFPVDGGRISVDISTGPSGELFFTAPQVITGNTSGAFGTLVRAITHVTVSSATGPFTVGETVTAAPSGVTGTVLATTVPLAGGAGIVSIQIAAANTNFDYGTPDVLTGGGSGDTADVDSATQELVLADVTGQFLDLGVDGIEETCSGDVDNTVAVFPTVDDALLASVSEGSATSVFAQVVLPEICLQLPGASSSFDLMRFSGWRYLAAQCLITPLVIVPIPASGLGSYLNCLLAEWDMQLASTHTIVVADDTVGVAVLGDTIGIQAGAFSGGTEVYEGELVAVLGPHPAIGGDSEALLLDISPAASSAFIGFNGTGPVVPGTSAVTRNGADVGATLETLAAGLPGTGVAPLGVDDVSVWPSPGLGSAAFLDGADRLLASAISPDVDLLERFENIALDTAVIPTTLLFEVLSAGLTSESEAFPATAVNSPAVDGANAVFLGAAGGIEVALGTDGAAADRQNDDTTGGVGGASAAQNILVSTGGVLVAGVPAWADFIPFAIGAVKRIEIFGDPNDQVFSAIGRGDEVLGLLPPAVASTGLNTGATQFAYRDLTVRCRLYGTVVAV